GSDLQRRIVERPVEDQDPRIDLQLLPVGEEGGVQRLHLAPGAQLAVVGGGEVDVAGELAFQALRADLQVVAEVEMHVERDRYWPALARRGPLAADDAHVVAELRQALARQLDPPAVGSQIAAERELLAIEMRLAAAGSDQA